MLKDIMRETGIKGLTVLGDKLIIDKSKGINIYNIDLLETCDLSGVTRSKYISKVEMDYEYYKLLGTDGDKYYIISIDGNTIVVESDLKTIFDAYIVSMREYTKVSKCCTNRLHYTSLVEYLEIYLKYIKDVSNSVSKLVNILVLLGIYDIKEEVRLSDDSGILVGINTGKDILKLEFNTEWDLVNVYILEGDIKVSKKMGYNCELFKDSYGNIKKINIDSGNKYSVVACGDN